MKSLLALRQPSSKACRSIGRVQARYLQLAAQGLLRSPRRRARRDDVVVAIERMRLLQIDSIHVIARSPYMVLYSRLGQYDRQWLDDALAQGRIAECWAHEACFVPAADFGLHHGWRTQRQGHWAHKNAARMQREHREGMDDILVHVREHGAVRTADFTEGERPPGASGWWSWKPQKRWLEAWFALGDLMVTRRERFQRVYDLAERVLEKLDPPFDTTLAARDHSVLRRRFIIDTVRALGVAQARWIADYYRLRPSVTDRELAPLCAEGELVEVSVEGWSVPGYVHRDHADLLDQAALRRLRATRTALLSPFDPLVWDRARALAMFDFEYTIECYLPPAKRAYGYYVLPILHRGRLVGRLDAKAHRAEGIFEIKAIFLEPGVEETGRMTEDLAAAIVDTAVWHGTPRVKVARSRPVSLAPMLRRAILSIGKVPSKG